VKVKSDKGWITLTGQVAWHYQKDAAEHEIRRMAGVVGLFNQITIMPPASPIDISNDITYALHRSWFETKTIAVSAKGGIVKLAGTAHSYRERQIAGDTAWAARGTTNVENDITVI
jgi:osmotically-inducible protein OsmY